jgi:DNA-binding response OmpR family regulator
MKVLLVEDSPSLRRSIGAALHMSGYAVDLADNGTDGLWRAESAEYDVVVLDLMLPGLGGKEVLLRLRERGHDVHVLLLTAKDSVEDRVAGLRAGADDYLTKPFAVDELIARVGALVRRRHGHKSPRLRCGDLEVDTDARTATRAGAVLDLTPREYAVLHLLAARAGEVVTRTQIEASVYDDKAEPMSNVVDAAICALRRKVDRGAARSLIATRRGIGYVLQAPPGGDGAAGGAGTLSAPDAAYGARANP